MYFLAADTQPCMSSFCSAENFVLGPGLGKIVSPIFPEKMDQS